MTDFCNIDFQYKNDRSKDVVGMTKHLESGMTAEPIKMKLDNNADLTLIIKGMTCNHCKKTATEAIESCNGVENVNIDLETGKTFIFGKTIDFSEIEDSINSVGLSSSKFS